MKKLFSLLAIALLFPVMVNNAFSQVTTVPAGTGPYLNLGAAFTAINTNPVYVGVAVRVNINANTTELAIATLNGGTFTSCLITPTAVVTVTGGLNSALIALNGAQNVTFDGRIGQTGTTISLTIANTDPGTGSGAIILSNRSRSNDIKFCKCMAPGVAVSSGGRVINVGQSTIVGGGNSLNIIENNLVIGGRRGIQTFGTAGSGGVGGATNDSTTIRNNIIKNSSALGIFIGSEVRDNTITGNEILTDVPTLQDPAGGYRAMGIQGVGFTNVFNNRIHDLSSTDSTTSLQGILYIPIILTAAGSNTSTLNLINNCVTLMTNYTAAPFINAINVTSNTSVTPYTANIYNNTAKVGGIGGLSVASFNACVAASPTIVGCVLNIFNNVCINTRTGSATSFNIGYDLTSFPIAGVTLTSDYQMARGSDPVSGFDGGYAGFVYRNAGLENYKDSTCAVAIEQHTMFKNVNFAGLNDCHLGLVGGDMCGKPLAAVTTDIDGDPRNATYPYKGADEKAGNPLKIMTVTACLEGKTGASATSQLNVILKVACVVKSTCTADLDNTTHLSKVCYGDSISNGTALTLDIKTLNHVETYSSGTSTFAAGLAAYEFISSPARAFGGNETPTSPACFYGGDVNQDSTIDLSDVVSIFNASGTFASGCRLRTDVNSDGTVDLSDLIITFNNSSNFVGMVTPCPEPSSINTSNEETTSRKIENRSVINRYLNTDN